MSAPALRASMKAFVPDLAIVPKLFTRSALVIPIPVSSIVSVLLAWCWFTEVEIQNKAITKTSGMGEGGRIPTDYKMLWYLQCFQPQCLHLMVVRVTVPSRRWWKTNSNSVVFLILYHEGFIIPCFFIGQTSMIQVKHMLILFWRFMWKQNSYFLREKAQFLNKNVSYFRFLLCCMYNVATASTAGQLIIYDMKGKTFLIVFDSPSCPTRTKPSL